MADYVDEYAYDCEGRLASIAQYGAAGASAVADKQITLTYNDQGLLATVARCTDGNLAVLAQYSYDSAGRLATLVYSQGETILASYAWTYGDDGSSLLPSSFSLPTSLSWLPSGGLMPGQDTGAIVDALWEGTGTPASLITEITSLDGAVSYSYDSAGQLLAATYTTGQTAEAYSYDAAGNRVTANGAAYLTGPNNQLLFDGIYSYSYDPEGNRTARYIDGNANGLLDAGDTAATTYAWDHRNRLTRVTDYDLYGDPATRAVDYLYDVENRWIGRDVDLDADGIIDTRTRFAYDGNQIVLQFDRALAPTGDPADPLTQDHLSHRYLWHPAAVDQLMADEHVTTDPSSPGSILWPLADHLGTIRDLAAYDSSTDTTTVVNHRTFDAYGNLQSQTNPTVDCLFAYTGRPLDQATNLQNNLHRWYDPATGRWMSEDPIGFEGRDGNLYVYVGNGPVNAVDPSGLANDATTTTHLVVISYFTPFGDRKENTSKDIAELTAKYLREKIALIGVGPSVSVIVKEVITGRYEWPGLDPQLDAWGKEGAVVDLWVALGEDSGKAKPEIELSATNYFRDPWQPRSSGGPIDPNGPPQRPLNTKDGYFKAFVESLERNWGNIDNAGTFSCNALFYQQLAAQKKHRDVLKQVMSMHVPALKRNNTTHSKRIDDYAKKLADRLFDYLSSALA